ncbi:MAG: hypothetical protein KJ964_02545 [Verrucomicrobia bacterium]|nr:hypothetical protein [Verrucomicrobiota bacterium]MBU1734011.1 hypothetical protein [Verrucomicrobiota bacterium]MBU1857107.1 hypothetical protein [Verrucomicrobiota bacterium]
MPAEEEYRSEAERLGDLLFKSTDGPDPEMSNLTEEEEIELEELWVSQGYNIILGPYDHPERWVDRISGPRVVASPTLQSIGNELPRLPPPPIMTWEEIEQGCPGQLDLNIPKLIPIPTVAERAFLVLAREWQADYEAQTAPRRLTSHMGDLALACLLLAVESGSKFTDVARQQMEINRLTAAAYDHPSWMNELPWELCQLSHLMSPLQSDAVDELTANLDHHNSSIRCWMMELGWFVVPWLNPVEATARLLKNLADTLIGQFRAAGLAARLLDKSEEFMAFARSFTPPDSFEDQYQNRLKRVKELGIQAVQAPFWETEAICRKEIERAVFGFRIRRVSKYKT